MSNLSVKGTLLVGTLVAIAVGVSACGEPVEKSLLEKHEAAPAATTQTVEKPDVDDIISRAQATHDKSVALAHGWTRTQPLINKASDALTSGDAEAAREMAERALVMAHAAVAQAELEMTAWKARVPK